MIQGVESDVVTRHEAYLSEDVEMHLTGADIPDDEFSEEPHFDEANWQSCASTRTWDTPARNSFVALCELVDRTRSRFERRMNSGATFVQRTNLLESHSPSKLDAYTEFNQGVGVDPFVFADSNEQVFEF